jgi:endonuclease III
MGLEEELSRISSYSAELGLNLHKPEDRFKWFLASILFAKRISANIAKATYRQFENAGLTTPERILEAGWDRLVEVLDSGGYVRYDFSTASNLLEVMKNLKEKYGNLEYLNIISKDPLDLEDRLEEFRGVGPVAVNIFLRELRGIWRNAQPKPSKISLETAKKLNLKKIEPYESALVRLNLDYCKKRKCGECPVERYCSQKISSRK